MPASMSPRTTHCNQWCVRQHRRAPRPSDDRVVQSIECRRGRDDCHYPNTKTISAMTDINVLIIVGLRAASVNRELAKVAADSSADGIALKMFDSLTDLPRYSETFESRGMPSSVGALRTAAAEADAVLILTTYHGRVPAVVHNAIDWLTRRWDQAACMTNRSQ